MALKYTIFFAILACVSGVNETQDCSVSRFVDFCYYNHYCACMGDHERRTDVVLTADCVNSTHTNVSWEAPSANLVNLQYSCFWSENDARLSGNYPVDFERSSQYTTGSKIVETIPPIVAGVYCKFFGCIESDHICGYQYFTANAVCGKRLGVNSTVVMSTSSQTASSTFLTAQPSIIPILMNNDTTTVSSSTKSTESSPSFPTTNADGSGDGTAFVIPIVLVFVVIVSATALLFSCFSFYRCRRSKADYNYERQLTQVDKVPEKIAPPLDILSTTYPVLSGSVLTVFNSLIYNDDKSTCMMKEQVTDSGYAKMDDGNDYASVSTEKADDELRFIRGDPLVDDDSSECFCKGTTVAFPVSPDPCIVTNMKFHLDLSEREELHHGRTESLSSGYLTTTEACNPMSPVANTSGCTIQSSLPPSLSLSDHNLANRTTSNEIKTDSLPSLLPTASSHVHSSAITLEKSHPRANVLTHDSATTSDYIESNQYSSTPMFNGCMEYRESDDAISLPDCDLCEVEIEGKEITITIQPSVTENVTSHYIRQESQKDCLPAGHQDSISFHSLDVEEGELETSESSSNSYPSFLQDPQIHPTEILGIQQMFVSDGGYLESSVCQPSVLATTLPLSHPYKEDLDDSFHFCEEEYQPGYVSSSEVSGPYLSSSTSLTKFGINHNSAFLSTVSNLLTTTTTTTMYASVDHDNDDCYIRDSCSATDTIIHPGSTSEEDARQLSSAHTSGELHRSPSPLSMYSLSSSFEVNGCSSVSGTD